ncbi:hypothetical protein MIR68_004711 [Amoeboaphelidium protococcarum]|nr:hypothetical protein MIR68_004711 [Amoeboaphelidium protococcarum]
MKCAMSKYKKYTKRWIRIFVLIGVLAIFVFQLKLSTDIDSLKLFGKRDGVIQTEIPDHFPFLYIPVSSRWRYLRDNLARLINDIGVPSNRIVIALNTDSVDALQAVQHLQLRYNTSLLHQIPTATDSITAKMTKNFFAMFEDAFTVRKASFAIFLEDDLRVSPDFYEYFRAAALLMQSDESVFCASGWHDNGFLGLSYDEHVFLRGEHFMGLGWMTSKKMYDTYFIDAIREPQWDVIWEYVPRNIMALNKHLECVFPEVPRTHHTMPNASLAYSTGSSLQHSRFDMMRLAQRWPNQENAFDSVMPSLNLSLLHVDNYDQNLARLIRTSLDIHDLKDITLFENAQLRFMCSECDSSHQFTLDSGWRTVLEEHFGMYSFGAVEAIIRGVHKDVVSLRYGSNRVFIVGAKSMFYEDRKITDIYGGSQVDIRRDQLITADLNQSCTEACEIKSMRCNEQQLAKINDCSTLKRIVQCKSCIRGSDGDKHAPALFSVGDDESSDGSCLLAIPRMLMCGGRSQFHQRLCYCE